MILRRLGKKTKIAPKILAHFPEHTLYVEPFFGAGGMFFDKPKAKYNIVNDLDEDVYNLFKVVKNSPQKLIEAWDSLPLHESLWNDWKRNPDRERDPVWKACRFLMLSNFGYLGKPITFRWHSAGTKSRVRELLKPTRELLSGVEFMCTDFEKVLSRIPRRALDSKAYTFVYADPPYLDTDNNYSAGFTSADSDRLFKCLAESGARWAMSEFDHPHIIKNAAEYNCNVIVIGERKNLLNRRTEILVTNYACL